MNKSIVVVGTLDTKGDALVYLKDLIEETGYSTILVDVGVLGDVPFAPSITRHEVAHAAASTISEIVELRDESRAMEKMAEGAAIIIRELHARGEIAGVLVVGGSTGTALGLELMKRIPLGIPKLILSTIAYSRLISPDIADSDTLMMPWVAGLWGLNRMSRRALETAAGAITGAAERYTRTEYPRTRTVAVSSLGVAINRYMERLKPALEERGYAVAVFHATGMNTRLMERAIRDGEIDAVLDLCVGTEIVADITGGVNSAGPNRLTAAGARGIPQIASPGGLEVFHWIASDPLPSALRNRPKKCHNSLMNIILSSVEERAKAGKRMAEKLNASLGPAAVVVPVQGLRSKRVLEEQTADPGAPLDPFFAGIMNPTAGTEAFLEALKSNLHKEIEVVALDAGVNDPVFVDRILELFDAMMATTQEERSGQKAALSPS